LWPFEVANVLTMAERRGRVTAEGVDEFLAGLQRLPIYVDRREPSLLWSGIRPLARGHGLSGYDAAYLELAKREGMELATLDEDLRRACGASGVVLVGG
jgi:predicted nucleic acid-binding protein